MSVVRAAVVRVESVLKHCSEQMGFYVYFKVLKRGRKPLRYMLVLAQDEMGAFTKAQRILRYRGYKV